MFLRQSTQIKVRIGPFVDVTDAFTPETGVALSTADEAELLKADGAATVDISGATWAAITGADGWYDLTLTTSHTDTVGELVVVVNDDSVCLPVFARVQVVEEATYDFLYASGATPIADINAEADTAISDAALATAANLATAQADLDTLTGTDGVTLATAQGNYAPAKAGDSMALTAAAVDAVWDEAQADHVAAGSMGIMASELADVLTDTGTTLDNLVDDLESRLGTPSDLGGGATVAQNLADIAGATFSTATDSNEAIRNHIGDGSNLTEAGGDGDHLTAINLPNQTMDIVGDITGNLSGSVGSVTGHTAQTGDSYGVLTGAHAEPTGAPAANETLADKIGYLFMALRNKVTVTASKKQFFDDGGAAEWEKDLSDDGTTYTESEGNAP